MSLGVGGVACGGATDGSKGNETGEPGGAGASGRTGTEGGRSNTEGGRATTEGGRTTTQGGRTTTEGGRTTTEGGAITVEGGATAGGAPTAGDGAGGTPTSGGAQQFQCRAPRQLFASAGASAAPQPPYNGYVECEDGWIHRVRAGQCTSKLPRTEPVALTGGTCTMDSDCTEKPHGYCESGGNTAPYCHYGCVSDADCSSGNICVCGDPVGICTPSDCVTDADCSEGLCAGTRTDICGPSVQFRCQRFADECITNEDCVASGTGKTLCSVSPEGRVCMHAPVCGRPFLVQGVVRTAAVVRDSACPDNPGTIDKSLATRLAAHFAELGLMEHASVAAFARFTLELLSLGAPLELVRECQRALGDELTHTELCFALASKYAGQRVGAGALSTDGALEGRSSFDIVTTAFLEACIGETIAAVEARAALEHARDPDVRCALEIIAADEARHAELGWHFIAWAVAQGSPAERRSLCAALRELAALESSRALPDAGEPADSRLLHYGVLDADLRKTARELAFAELILPWSEALLSDSRALAA